ncbi:MAG: cellulase family glycosylhydrolase [bacterium]
MGWRDLLPFVRKPIGCSRPTASSRSGVRINEFLGAIEEKPIRCAPCFSEAGGRWFRLPFFWSELEPNPPVAGKHDYRFHIFDGRLAWAERFGIKIIGILMIPPLWTDWRPKETGALPAESEDAFLAYVEACARRYQGRVAIWEVLNEVNWEESYTPPDIYARLLRRSYEIIKKSDPNARVAMAGLAYAETSYLQDVWRHFRGEGHVFADDFSLHPFCMPFAPEHSYIEKNPLSGRIARVGNFVENIETVWKALRQSGVKGDLWVGEMGWTTAPLFGGSVSEDTQAWYAVRMIVQALATQKISKVMWAWTFRDYPFEYWKFWGNTGVVRLDHTPKPAYIAWKNLYEFLRDADYLGNRNSKDVFCYEFARPDEGLAVAWSLRDGATFEFNAPTPGGAQWSDWQGSVLGKAGPGAPVNLSLNESPILLRFPSSKI